VRLRRRESASGRQRAHHRADAWGEKGRLRRTRTRGLNTAPSSDPLTLGRGVTLEVEAEPPEKGGRATRGVRKGRRAALFLDDAWRGIWRPAQEAHETRTRRRDRRRGGSALAPALASTRSLELKPWRRRCSAGSYCAPLKRRKASESAEDAPSGGRGEAGRRARGGCRPALQATRQEPPLV